MSTVSLTGKDTFIIGTRIFADLADGDTVTIVAPNNISESKTGKNGNTIIAYNATGKIVEVTIRAVLASADDKFLNSELAAYINDPAAYVPKKGEFIKRSGDGQGNVNNTVYTMEVGVPMKMPDSKENVEGDTEQSVAIWQWKFSNTDRIIA